MFIEVNSIQPKNCKLIINLNHVIEVAPLVAGGCVLTFAANEAGVSRTVTVSDDFSEFKQFAMQTVTAESINKRFPKVSADKKEKAPGGANIKDGPNGVDLDIPSYGQ